MVITDSSLLVIITYATSYNMLPESFNYYLLWNIFYLNFLNLINKIFNIYFIKTIIFYFTNPILVIQ